MRGGIGNLPTPYCFYPNCRAPIVRNHNEVRELAMARWGMPSPAFALAGKNADSGVTNVSNTKSRHWLRWLGPENCYLVPFTSFAENEHRPDGSKPPVLVTFDRSRPLAVFVGIWEAQWKSVLKVKEGETIAVLFALLTPEPNSEVGAIHSKAMPVILTAEAEQETWMTAPTPEALRLRQPLPNGSLAIAARGMKSDEPAHAS